MKKNLTEEKREDLRLLEQLPEPLYKELIAEARGMLAVLTSQKGA